VQRESLIIHHHLANGRLFVNPFTFQTDITGTVSSIRKLIQAGAEELETENMDIHDNVLKHMKTF
jgi:hypothetical protein